MDHESVFKVLNRRKENEVIYTYTFFAYEFSSQFSTKI